MLHKQKLNERLPGYRSCNKSNPIYLDNHASTPIDPRVLEQMMPFLTNEYGNAAAVSHAFGWRAEAAIENARRQVAKAIGANPQEIIFTSGATESNNTVLKGFSKLRKNHIVTSLIEHSSVLDTCLALQRKGVPVTFVAPDCHGIIEVEALKEAVSSHTGLISIMAANNEIGTLNDIESIATLARENDILFHSDLTQALGRIFLDMQSQDLSMASISAHKIYGPKGVGALYIRQDLQDQVEPLMHGGKHEHGIRSGTLNVAGIVGFGAACELINAEMESENQRLLQLRERLLTRLQNSLPNIKVNGCIKRRLPGNLNISFESVDGEELFLAIQPAVAISRGSACATTADARSHVLRALHVPNCLAQATIRFGIGRFNTEEEIDFVADIVIKETEKLLNNK